MKRLFMVFVVFCALQAATAGAASFTNNGNGTVTDNGTGLMWQQGEPGAMTWANALTYCEALSLAGQPDWRLPNIKELESITDDTKYNPVIDTTYFQNASANVYWSSTAIAFSTDFAWIVHFNDGYVSNYYKSSSHGYVRCVRGGQSGSLGTFVLSSTSQTFTSTGGTASITITGSGAWTATSSLSWATITSGASGTGSGTVVISVAANTTGATRTGNITIAGQTFAITQTGVNNCAASVSSSLVLHIPVVTYSGSNYWADLQYNSNTGQLTVAGADKVSNISAYSNCTASTLSSGGTLHIPVVMLSGVSYWLDLLWNGSVFVITGAGLN